jgi:hypothetical protein
MRLGRPPFDPHWIALAAFAAAVLLLAQLMFSL